jgi:signal peptidase II
VLSGKPENRFVTRWYPFLVAAAVLVFDHATKIYIRAHLNDLDSISVVPSWIRIIHTENPGAAFGMLADGSPLIRGAVLIGISLLVLLFVLQMLLKRPGTIDTLTRLALGFILGGAAGNLYDRITRGTVTDFLEVYNGTWSFPAFNVADSAITVGSVLLVIELFWPAKKKLVRHVTAPPTEP